MTPEDRKAQIRRMADELWNQGNLDVCDESYAENCSLHDPSFPTEGVKALKAQARDLRAANPDLHMDVHDIMCDGDMTCARWTMAGTARGEFRGIPGTGKTWVMSGMTIDKWQDDRVVEEWVNYDLLGTLQQIGVIPALGRQEQST